MTIRVMLADDEALVRAGLRLLVDSEDDLDVVGEAADGETACEVAERTQPDVILMDVRMPKLDGLAAARRISERVPSSRVIVLTTFDEDAAVDAALRQGVAGFLLKTSPPEEVLAAVRAAAAGRGALDSRLVPRLIASYAAAPGPRIPAPELATLTPRETDVLRLVAQGLNNAEIAAHLFLGETTVKTHFGRVLDKLSLRDRAQAIAFAYEAGLVSPGEKRRPDARPG